MEILYVVVMTCGGPGRILLIQPSCDMMQRCLYGLMPSWMSHSPPLHGSTTCVQHFDMWHAARLIQVSGVYDNKLMALPMTGVAPLMYYRRCVMCEYLSSAHRVWCWGVGVQV